MIKGLLTIAAAAGALVAVPAVATNRPEPVASAAATTAPAAEQKQVRYCQVASLTGSRVPRRTCKTRTDWLKEGVDPAALR